MNEDQCIRCGCWTWTNMYAVDPLASWHPTQGVLCGKCQKERFLRRKHEVKSGYDMWRESGEYKQWEPYPYYDEFTKDVERHESHEAAKTRKAAEKKHREEAKILAEKQRRCREAEERPCAGCERQGLCDPDDFLCIICRDGESAVAPGYLHRWTEIQELDEAA